MTISPRLLAKLERAARESGKDLNEFLSLAVGVCPTCGQELPPDEPNLLQEAAKVRKSEPVEAAPASSMGRPVVPDSMRQRVLAYMLEHHHEGRGVTARCAEKLGCSLSYASGVWSKYTKDNGIGSLPKGRAPGAKTAAIIEYLQKDQKTGAQGRAAKRFKVSRAWVSAVWKGHQRGAKAPRDGAAA